MHVRGLAVDVGGPGADWLEEHGGRFGLCRTLDWEWWHFEWRDPWPDEGACPSPVHDPAAAPGPYPASSPIAQPRTPGGGDGRRVGRSARRRRRPGEDGPRTVRPQ